MTMQMFMWISLVFQVTNHVVSQEIDFPNERWDQDPIVQDIARELGKFLKEYIEKYCKNSTRWIDTKQSDEHPVYVKASMQSTEPDEETLVVQRSFIERLPENELTGDRRSVTNGSEEVPEEDDEGIVLEIEDQPKDSKSVLTADELVLSINGPEGTRRSSVTLPSELQQIIGEYLRQRRRRRKRFKISIVENNQIELSGGSSANGVIFRRAGEPTMANEYTEDDPRFARKFIRIVPNSKLKPKRVFSAGIRIGMLPGDEVVSKPIHLQMGLKKIPGFNKYIPGMKQSPSFGSGSIQFGRKPLINKFEIKGRPSTSFGSFKLSTENKPYDMYQYKKGNKKPKGQFNIQQIPGEYIPGQVNGPYGYSKLSLQNTPYQYEIPGSPAQMVSPYGSMEFAIGGPKQPYGPDIYSVPQYGIPGPIQFKIPGQVDGPYGFLKPGQANIPYGSLKLSTENKPYGIKIPGQSISEQIKFELPGQGNIPYGPFNLPDSKIPLVSYGYNPPSTAFYPDPVYGISQLPENYEELKLKFPKLGIPGQIKYDFPGQSIPGQNFVIPGQKFDIPGQKFDIPGQKFDIPGQKFDIPPPKFDISVQKFKIPGQKFDIPGHPFDIPGAKFDIPGQIPIQKFDFPGQQLDIPGQKFDIPAPKFDIPVPKFEISGQKFDIPGQPFNIPGAKFNIPGQKFDIPIQKFDFPGQQFDIPGQKFDIPGQKFDIPVPKFEISEQKFDIPGQKFDIPVHKFEIPGQKFDIPGQKFEIPGGFTPGQAKAPIDSFKLSFGNKPYDSKIPSNNYQFEIPGQKFEIPGQKFEIPGGYTPGQVNTPIESFKFSIGNKPYDINVPSNNYQFKLPGQKFEMPGAPSASFKLSLGNKPYDSIVPGLSRTGIKPPYGPDTTYNVNQNELPGQQNSNPSQLDLPAFDIKPESSKYQYSFPGQAYQSIGLHSQPRAVGLQSHTVQVGVHSRPAEFGYTQYSPGAIYYQESSPTVAGYRESYSVKPRFTDGFRRKMQNDNDTSQDEPEESNEHDQEYVDDVPPKLQENLPVHPVQKDLRDELLRRAMSQIEQEFDDDMKKTEDQQQPVIEEPKEERDDNKNVQEQTEEPQTEEPSTPQYDTPSTTNQPTSIIVTLAEPVKNLTKSSEEGYVYGISSDSSDEETTLANTYAEYSKGTMEYSDEQGHRRKCDDTSEADYEYDYESAEESTVQSDEKRRTSENVALHWALNEVKEMMDKDNATQIKEDSNVTEEPTLLVKPQHDMMVINITEVRKFSNRPDSFNGSLEYFKPYGSSLKESTNSSEITHNNLPDQNVDETPNNGAVALDIGKLFPPADTSNDGRITDNMTMYISETMSSDEEYAKPEVLPVNPNTDEDTKPEVLTVNPNYGEDITPEELTVNPNYGEDITPEVLPVKPNYGEDITPEVLPVNPNYGEDITPEVLPVNPNNGEDTTPELLPVNPNIEQTEYYSTIEDQNTSDTPVQRRNTEVMEPVPVPQDENIEYTQDTGDFIPEEPVSEQVFEPIYTEETFPTLQTETMVYTEGVENPTETQTMQFEYLPPSTFAPYVVEDYTESVDTVTFTEFPPLTTDEGVHLETVETIEPGTDLTVEPQVTIADMGQDIDYVQYYRTEDPGHEVTVEETTTPSTDLEYTTLSLLDSPTTVQFTTLIYEDTPTTVAPVTEENQENVQENTDTPQRRNKESEDSTEDTTTDPSFENGLPFLKNKLMSEDYKDDGNYENYILEDILQKPFDALTDKEKVIFERMTDLAKHPDNLTVDNLPENYRPLNATDDQFLIRGLLNDDTLNNDYLRKGVILLKNYPFEKDIDTLKTRTDLQRILSHFKKEPTATTNEEKRMNLVLSLLASHPKELDSVYEAMVKKHGEPDADELAVIDQWLILLNYNKGIELMYKYNNNGGGSEDDFRIFIMENLMKKQPDALTEDEQRFLDSLVSLYKTHLMPRPNKEDQAIVDDDLYKLGILTMHDSPNQDNLGLLPQELLEFVFKKPDTELNDREYKIYNYLMKLAKNPNELLQRYYDVLGTVKNDLDEKYAELNNGTIPTSFENVSASLNGILPKKRPEELTEHDYYILYLLKYLEDNKELAPHLEHYEQNMIYNLPLFKYGIMTTANSPNRNKPQLLSDEILKTVMKKPKEELNAKEKMTYNYLMQFPSNFAYLMDTYNVIVMNMLKDGAPANEEHGRKKNKYMVAIIKIPIKSHEENGDVIMNKTIRISMDNYHQTIANLAGEPIDNEKAVFIMPAEDGESLSPLDFDDKTKLVHKLEITRDSLKVHRAHPSKYAEVIPQYLDDLIPDLVRLLQSGSTQSFNESGVINYDVNENEPGDNLQQLLGRTILQIRRRKINPTEVDDGELIQYLTTLQRNLMTEIKSKFGTTDFKQEPVKVERRYMGEDLEESAQDDSDAAPVGQRRALLDTPVQLAMNAVAKWFMAQNQMQQPNPYRRAYPRQQVQQYYQDNGHRRGIMDTPVQLAMNAVAKWFMAQNQMQPPNSYRRNVPDQDTYPQAEDFQENMTIPVGQRRSLIDAPLQLAKNTVRKFVGARNDVQPLGSFRRNIPDEPTTVPDQNVSPQAENLQEQVRTLIEQRRALMGAPLQLAKNTVRKFVDIPNKLQPLASFRRNVPDEHTPDFPNEHTTQKVEPARRYLDYFEDSPEDFLYDDYLEPFRYFRRSNNEHVGRKEEIEESTTEKVMPKANRRSDDRKSGNSPYITVQIQRNTNRPGRNKKNQFRRNGKHDANSRVWTIKGLKRRSLPADQGPDEDVKRLLTAMRRANPLDNDGDNQGKDNVGRKRRKHRRRGKHGRYPRRRRIRKRQRQPELIRKFNPESAEPKAQEGDVENVTNIVPSRRQFGPFGIFSALNPLQIFGKRRNESPIEQVQPTTVTAEANVAPGTQTTGFQPTTQQVDVVQDTTTPLVPSRRQFPLSILGGLMPFGGGGNAGGGGFNPLAMLGGLNPFQMLGKRRNEEESTTKQTEPIRVLGHEHLTPVYPGGRMNYNGQNNGQAYKVQNVPNYNVQNNVPNYNAENNIPNDNAQNIISNDNPQNNIQTYTDANMPQDYATTPGSAQDNAEPAPEAGQMNYDPQNNDEIQTPENIPSTSSPIEPSLEPSQKNRRSADSTSLISFLNPVDLVRRLNPFISRDEKPAVQSMENSTKLEENVTSQYKPEEQEDNQTQRREIELEDEKNSTENVENTLWQESNDTTEHDLASSMKNEEAVTGQNIPEEQEYNETQRRQLDPEYEKNITDNVENATRQDNNNTSEDNSQEEEKTDVQQEDTTELAEEEDRVMETTQYPDPTETGSHPEGNSTQLSSETIVTT